MFQRLTRGFTAGVDVFLPPQRRQLPADELSQYFGLHISALAASEMGGALTCSSPGPGQGASFFLELPALANQPMGP